MTNEAILGILDSLSNEARNSQHAVFGLLELPDGPIPDSSWRSCVEIGRTSADRLLHVIDDVREVLASSFATPDVCDEFDLSVCLRETVELLNFTGGHEGNPVSLGRRAEALPVRQDRHAVEQVLMRVLSAARKLARARAVCIEESVLRDGFRFMIDVSDAGAAERLASWLNMEPEQACFPSPTEVPLIVGVMAAGRRIRAMGGSAERVQGALACLVVNLPMVAATADGPGGPGQERKVQLESLNVLMAEDCDDSYALSELLLRKENLWRATNGQEAFELVRKQRFDVVFMDVHMPGIDGYTAIRAIRDWETQSGNARTPIVVLSSDDLETQRRSAVQSGCSGFLRKPLRNGDLLNVLDRLKAARSPAHG
jgi:CheY-like chemotaxis protein